MRVLFFAYGAVAYSLFLGTFVYLMGFVANIGVPKTIDSGVEGPLAVSILINALLLSLFVVQHTIMARPAFKSWWTQVIPKPVERSTFVLVTCAVLILMVWQWRPLGGVIWDVQNSTARMVLLGLSLAGWLLVLYSSFLIDHFELFGLRQVWVHLQERENPPQEFVVRSVYNFVRNPLMLGFLIAFWFTPHMSVGHLLFAVLTTGYVLLGTWFEERDIAVALGERYIAYRKRTPLLIPFTKRAPADEAKSEST